MSAIEVEEPFATVDELKQRWPDFPLGAEAYAKTHLLEASQYIVDVAPGALEVTPATRRRVVCSVVRRAMQADAAGVGGVATSQETMGPFSATYTVSNPNGDYYLTKQELKALGGTARPKAFGVKVADYGNGPCHRPWCSLYFASTTCSCGASLTLGDPLWEE